MSVFLNYHSGLKETSSTVTVASIETRRADDDTCLFDRTTRHIMAPELAARAARNWDADKNCSKSYAKVEHTVNGGGRLPSRCAGHAFSNTQRSESIDQIRPFVP